MGFPAKIDYWKEAILKFHRDVRPDLAGDNTRGYFRFLEWRGMLSQPEADRLCQLAAQRTFCAPETYVRARRELAEKGLIRVVEPQASFLEQAERETREHYRADKRNNPVWDH